jgi:2-polyprenyl-3-methyl-5-hydroxy-6-metoxy-1,4-benzoquinol methylase
MSDHARIGEYYDARAARYHNPVTDFVGEREMRVIRPLVPEGSTLLDYGCGSGRSTLDHLRRGCTVTAYDLSAEMIAIAKERALAGGLSAEFTTDATVLEGRRWPLVTAIGVLDYYPDPVPMLHTLREHVAPGGRLVVTFPNAASPGT